MRYLLFVIALMSALVSCDKPKPVDPCPPSCPRKSSCVDGACVCNFPGATLVNNKWCARPGSFIAYVSDWYCMDTFSFLMEIPQNFPPAGVLGNSIIQITNSRAGDWNHRFEGSHQSLFYFPHPDGDSIEVYWVPTPKGLSDDHCIMDGGYCDVNMFGKFRSPDTIDAMLRLFCKPNTLPEHGDEVKVLCVRIK